MAPREVGRPAAARFASWRVFGATGAACSAASDALGGRKVVALREIRTHRARLRITIHVDVLGLDFAALNLDGAKAAFSDAFAAKLRSHGIEPRAQLTK